MASVPLFSQKLLLWNFCWKWHQGGLWNVSNQNALCMREALCGTFSSSHNICKAEFLW